MPSAVALQDFTLFPPNPAQFDLAQSIRDPGILGSFDPDVPQSGAFRAFRRKRPAFFAWSEPIQSGLGEGKDRHFGDGPLQK